MHLVTRITAVASILAAACSSAPPNEGAPAAAADGNTPAVAADGSSYTVTSVKIGADGREEATVYPMTQAKSIERAALATGELHAEDYNAGKAPCSNSSVHLYDATLTTCQFAGCNELCIEVENPSLNVDSYVYLGTYCVTPACKYSWNSMVRSYWTGDRYALLWRNYAGAAQCSEGFGARWSYEDAAWCGENSDYLIIPRSS